MGRAHQAKDPIVYSYLALRKAVGYVAVGLPFVLVIPWWLLGSHSIEGSISGYYYTGMRNFLVGSLCAISMFMLCCRGYDRWDEIAGFFSAACALGVALFPTTPAYGATPHQQTIGIWHYTFATLLLLTLACFCLFLFRKTADKKTMTRMKRWRNGVYTACGCAILASLLLIFILVKIFPVRHLFGNISPMLFFETTSLWAFGIAWLVKGERFLKDEAQEPSGTESNGPPSDGTTTS
jgi:hypothetical protein